MVAPSSHSLARWSEWECLVRGRGLCAKSRLAKRAKVCAGRWEVWRGGAISRLYRGWQGVMHRPRCCTSRRLGVLWLSGITCSQASCAGMQPRPAHGAVRRRERRTAQRQSEQHGKQTGIAPWFPPPLVGAGGRGSRFAQEMRKQHDRRSPSRAVARRQREWDGGTKAREHINRLVQRPLRLRASHCAAMRGRVLGHPGRTGGPPARGVAPCCPPATPSRCRAFVTCPPEPGPSRPGG